MLRHDFCIVKEVQLLEYDIQIFLDFATECLNII